MSDRDGTLGQGAVLEGRYRLLEEIARGGFGMVFRAHQIQMDREVAVKTLPPEFVKSDEMVERFRREARFASQLSHPNTVTIHDYGKHEAYLYLVMELLEGEDLADVLARDRTVPLERILPIARQVLKSLREAHEHNIVHRDLKPENVFLSEIGEQDEVVKVLDFGIAKLAIKDPGSGQGSGGSSRRRLTAEGTTMGTPIYMSPEQAAGDGIDHRTDLYALGVILYEMACGVPPFDDDESAVVMRQHIHAEVPEFSDPKLRGTWLDDVVRIALRKNREDRFENATEFLEAIDEAVERSTQKQTSLHKDSDSVLERYESDETDTSHRTTSSETPSPQAHEETVTQLEAQDRVRESSPSNSSSIVTVLEEPNNSDDVVLLDDPKHGSDDGPPAEHRHRGLAQEPDPAAVAPETEDSRDEREITPNSPERAASGGRPNDSAPRAPSSSKSDHETGRERRSSSWSWGEQEETATPTGPRDVPDLNPRPTWQRILMTLLVVGLLVVVAFLFV